MSKSSVSYLNAQLNPQKLRCLQPDDLAALCNEIREYLIDVVSRKGGHFAASLGVVELSVALHYVFNTPNDELIWDVGHQAYVHKLLTGRLADFESLRTYNGISGFPKRDESEFDSFGTGHASTSISAALGMAMASQLAGNYQKQHIAVVGDGALTGGLAFEGLNNAGVNNANLLIILNDNGISIDKAVGALSAHQLLETTLPLNNGLSDGRARNKSPKELNQRGIKAVNLGYKAFFESLGINYSGITDGHNLNDLIEALQIQKRLKGPRVLHIKTIKGKGYQPAENDQVTWHSPGKFDKLTGERTKSENQNSPLKYQEVFGHTLVELAKSNKQIVGITPAMPSGSSMNIFMQQFPERGFDVGIAEEHAVTFSAGLSTQGFLPFCNIYSTFMQRAVDQVIHDVSLQNLPVVFCLDRAGIVGEDGPTHHGMFDVPMLRSIPNLVLAAPKDEIELRHMMFSAQDWKVPVAIRYPRGKGVHQEWQQSFDQLEVGKGEKIQTGKQVAILCFGSVLQNVLAAQNNFHETPSIYNMRFAKPIDSELLKRAAKNHQVLITIENGALQGGFGSAVLEELNSLGIDIKVIRLGIKDEFIPHGSVAELEAYCDIDSASIARTVNNCF